MNRFSRSVVLAGVFTVAGALPGAGQEKKEPADARLAIKVTLTVENVTLEDLLRRLGKDYDLNFVVAGGMKAGHAKLRDKRVAKLSVKDEPLGQVLTDALKSVGATYRAKPGYIEVSAAES